MKHLSSRSRGDLSGLLKKTLCLASLFFCFSSRLFAQTIDYSYVSLTGCNVFMNGPTVQNYVHQTVYGSPAYVTAQNAVSLPINVAPGSAVGVTEYAIAYHFKQGYSYTIQVYASGTQMGSNSSPGEVGLGFSNSLPATNSGSNGCDSYAQVAGSNFSSFAIETVGTSWAWLTHLVTSQKMTQDQAYLLVAGLPSLQTEAFNYVYVRTITITESAPSTTISPASISANCGYPVTQTFTLGNGGLSNISGYTWNLPAGSANGWSYNGAPASFPITTTGNTITLTASCPANGLGNIVGSVDVGGTPIASATATVAVNNTLPPGVAITGTPAVCGFNGSASFGITGAPSCPGSSVTWSWDSPDLSTLSTQSGSTTTLTNTQNANGTGNLSVTIATTCGTNTITEPIGVSALNLIGGTYYSQQSPNSEQSPVEGMSWFVQNAVASWQPDYPTQVFLTPSMPGAYSWSYAITPGYPQVATGPNGPGPGFYFDISGDEIVSWDITANSFCGPVTNTFQFAISGYDNVLISPNPVHGGQVTVSLKNNNTSVIPTAPAPQRMIYAVKLTDLSGRVLKSMDYKLGITTANIQFTGVQPGNYFISIYDGKKWNTRLLLMEK